jgi:hypothetical protein
MTFGRLGGFVGMVEPQAVGIVLVYGSSVVFTGSADRRNSASGQVVS